MVSGPSGKESLFPALGLGETWRYKAGVLDSQVTSYKLVGVELY